MVSSVIDIHDLSEGVDRKQLNLIKQRFLDLNELRYQRTCTALTERQQQFLALLPLLFHVNHPMLPGYYSHQTASGIHHYEPDQATLHLSKTFARSFKYQRDLMVSHAAIDAIFVMGSIGTIAYSESSDLDIWVCHGAHLQPQQLLDLQRKCQRISQWAEQDLHLEIHFFLMDSVAFRAGKISKLSSEDSGSTQHFLLLDEFYRTALWLAGKLPLWWFVPASQEQDYETYSKALLARRFIRADDVIDFGGIPNIPPNEFIGAGIWQLYKAIAAPYKSVLKLLLLEIYASNDEREKQPLALTLKHAIYQDAPDGNELDPYVMIYHRLENYLNTATQTQRLELIRRCFYFKVNKPLTRVSRGAKKSWQRLLLEKLASSWGWENYHLHVLDNRAHWKADQVMAERALLVNELSNSYRLLSEISKNPFADAAISNEELMVLGRKLHAAFERKAGKIEWINPGISDDLQESALCLVQEAREQQDSWHLYRGSHKDLVSRAVTAEPIKRTRHLMELLLWCHCNGLLAGGSKLEIVSDKIQLSSIQRQQLLHTLAHWQPLPLPVVSHDSFKQSAQPTRILLLLNLGVEPQTELHKKGLQMLSNQSDALGYSGFKENLIVSADIVQCNSWQEIVCRHYSSDALINSLLHYLRLLPPGRGLAPPELTIRCFSAGQGSIISQRLEELWRDLIACYYSGTRPGNSRYVLEVGDEYLVLQFLQQQPQISRYKSYEKLLEKLARAQLSYSPIVIDRYGLNDKPLKFFCATMNAPDIYVFYQAPGSDPHFDTRSETNSHHRNDRARVTIFDEQGSLFTTDIPFYNQQTLLRPLYYFIQAAMARQHFTEDLAPQNIRVQPIKMFELKYPIPAGEGQAQKGNIEPRKLTSDTSRLHFINIQAIAELNNEGEIIHTIYCGDQEFSELQHGGNLFTVVARFILSRRLKSERYPCYITDLDLSLCRDLLAPQSGLQLIHYLQIKEKLEQQLNAALSAL